MQIRRIFVCTSGTGRFFLSLGKSSSKLLNVHVRIPSLSLRCCSLSLLQFPMYESTHTGPWYGADCWLLLLLLSSSEYIWISSVSARIVCTSLSDLEMRNKDRAPSDRVAYKFSLFLLLLLLLLLCTRGISSQCFVLCDSYAYLNPYSQTIADCIGRTATRKSGVLYIYRHIRATAMEGMCVR